MSEMLRVDVVDDSFWMDDEGKSIEVRVWMIQEDLVKFRITVSREMEYAGVYQMDDVELSNLILDKLAELNYQVVPLGRTVPTETFSVEQIEVLFSTFYVKRLFEKPREETPDERVDRLLAEQAATMEMPDYEHMTLDELLALTGTPEESETTQEVEESQDQNKNQDPDTEKPEE